MTPGMGVAGGALALGGGLLNYYGQTQGAKAMQEEADRQAAEQQAFSQARYGQVQAALDRQDPSAAGVGATVSAARQSAATAPALAAGSTALGLGGGSRASVGQALLPMQRMSALQEGRGGADRHTSQNLGRLRQDTGRIDDASRLAQGVYASQLGAAGSKGAAFRTGGELMQGAGMATMVAAMNQAPEAPVPGGKPAMGADAPIPKAPVSASEASGVAGQRASYIDMADLPQAGTSDYGLTDQQMQGQALYDAWPTLKRKAVGAWDGLWPTPPPRPMSAG